MSCWRLRSRADTKVLNISAAGWSRMVKASNEVSSENPYDAVMPDRPIGM